VTLRCAADLLDESLRVLDEAIETHKGIPSASSTPPPPPTTT
jgi:hypothetical protein